MTESTRWRHRPGGRPSSHRTRRGKEVRMRFLLLFVASAVASDGAARASSHNRPAFVHRSVPRVGAVSILGRDTKLRLPSSSSWRQRRRRTDDESAPTTSPTQSPAKSPSPKTAAPPSQSPSSPRRWYKPWSYVDRDSVLYDALQGFTFAAALLLFLICCCRTCNVCCVACGICPSDDRVRRYGKRRMPSRQDVDDGRGIWSPIVGHGDDDEELELIGRRGGVGDDDSSEESLVSMEYGDVQLEDEYGEVNSRLYKTEGQVRDAAHRYFGDDERGNGGGTKEGREGTGNGGGDATAVRGQRSAAELGLFDDDETDGAKATGSDYGASPLDLEMIEKRLVDDMAKTTFV